MTKYNLTLLIVENILLYLPCDELQNIISKFTLLTEELECYEILIMCDY